PHYHTSTVVVIMRHDEHSSPYLVHPSCAASCARAFVSPSPAPSPPHALSLPLPLPPTHSTTGPTCVAAFCAAISLAPPSAAPVALDPLPFPHPLLPLHLPPPPPHAPSHCSLAPRPSPPPLSLLCTALQSPGTTGHRSL
ncbi:unnamed protein product, partial [Closterium sp. NIES-54]